MPINGMDSSPVIAAMEDVRDSQLYRDAESLFTSLFQPGSGLVCDATDISTDGISAVFCASMAESLSSTPVLRIAITELATGLNRILTFGPNSDRCPRYSPDGRTVAFLSDRNKAGDFQLFLVDPISGAARGTPAVSGSVEYLQWSPDGRRILLGVAAHGADVAGVQGAVSMKKDDQARPSWMPEVATRDPQHGWRSVWIYEVSTNEIFRATKPGSNIWEAAWCGSESIVAVVSSGPSEGLWYVAELHRVDLKTHQCTGIYRPEAQIGWPSASPSGDYISIVEAFASDRGIVAGNLRIVVTNSGSVLQIDTGGIDVTHTEWRSATTLLTVGHRGLETVVAVFDVAMMSVREVWSSHAQGAGSPYARVSGIGEAGDCALISEGFLKAPEIGLIRSGQYSQVKTFETRHSRTLHAGIRADGISWKSKDGLEIQGWLLRPDRKEPQPLVMIVHGGPVWHWSSFWLGRRPYVSLLLQRGYAVFLPNPRGSTGRGQNFVRRVVGDMGGLDAHDCLTGLDHLVDERIADRDRLGVTGGSYGGFMTAWLISQDDRFAAAAPVSPITNHVTEHLTSNIPHYSSLFLRDSYTNLDGAYYRRSPIVYVRQVKTPTLTFCGALDRCTPPGEAVQFHNALLENECQSVLVTYPQEGHGVRKWPAAIDFATRLVAWFEQHMPCQNS
jgi:dipeptidyl aminopeptidase/acylaminoacyl peptidase